MSEPARPYVYAVYFRAKGLLKVGFTTGPHYLRNNRAVASERFGAADGVAVWLRPGDTRAESFVQTHLSFRYPQPPDNGSRLSEWFLVGSQERFALTLELDAILSQLPEFTSQEAA